MDNTIMNSQTTWYINPNTGNVTSNKKNTIVAPENREDVRAGFMRLGNAENFLNVNPFTLPLKTYIDRMNNSANLAEGMTIRLNGGYTIKLTKEHGFIIDYGNPDTIHTRHYDERYFDEVSSIQGALNILLEHSSEGSWGNFYSRIKDYDRWEKALKMGLERIGIDISKDFTLNGMKYTRNSDGRLISERMTAAQVAYEREIANNRRYESADERTHRMIRYRSNYYLSTAPDDVKNAWQEAMEETDVNPFVAPCGNTLAQLAVEQDFATGGNDQLFGETVESSIEAVKKIIDRIDNPLGDVPKEHLEEHQQISQREREFYVAFLEKLEKLAAK